MILLLALVLSFPSALAVKTPATKIITLTKPQLQTQLKAKKMQLRDPMFIRIFKKTARNKNTNQSGVLEVWKQSHQKYRLFKTYPICYYSGHLGPKKTQGDAQAPEGIYQLTPHQLQPFSSYRLAVDVGYPNKYDRQQHSTGNDIMIHGGCESKGCFAMSDSRMDEIYSLIHAAFKSGQKTIPLHIFPFKLSKKLDRKSPYYSYWKKLQKPYRQFEKTHKLS